MHKTNLTEHKHQKRLYALPRLAGNLFMSPAPIISTTFACGLILLLLLQCAEKIEKSKSEKNGKNAELGQEIVIISDCALGWDKRVADTEDGVALFFALLSPRACVRAIISTFGNLPEEDAYKNIKKIVELAEPHSKCTPDVLHGAKSKEDSTISEGAKYIAELLETQERTNKKNVYVISLGSLTTLKQVLQISPEALQKAKVVVMGGEVYVPGNVPPDFSAEFNFFFDPQSTKEVFEKLKMEIYPLDVAYKFHITEVIDFFTGEIGKYIVDNSKEWFSTPFAFMFDTLAVAGALYPEIIKEKLKIKSAIGHKGEVILPSDENEKDKTEFKEQEFILDIDKEKFKEIFKDIFIDK